MESNTGFDRLNFTLLFSILLHLTIVLGVGFGSSSPKNSAPANLDITLVKQKTELEPEDADYLAQANNEGGGETDEKSPTPTPEKTLKPNNRDISKTKQTLAPKAMVQPTPSKTIEKPKKLITQRQADRKVASSEELIKKTQEQIQATPRLKPVISASELMAKARNDISLREQRLDLAAKSSSKRPKSRALSSRTKEYAAAAYHEAWRKKVERIGTLNYPQEAKQKGINGSLVLAVDINPDGSVSPNGIRIIRSSGYELLDDAAIKIVRLASPYAPIPDNVLQAFDLVTITRTWKFETNNGLFSR